jgi:hypothetical protein
MSKPTTKYVKTAAIGGEGGQPFEILSRQDHVLKSLRFWWEGHTVRGIEATLTNDQRESVGQKVGDDKLLELSLTEEITSLQIYKTNTASGARCGGVRIKTNTGTVFEAGPMKGTPSELKKGKAAGIFGRAGADIDQLGFIYANEVDHYELTDVTYDLSKLNDSRIGPPTAVVRGTLINRSDEKVIHNFSQSVTESKTNSWSSSWSIKVGVKASGEAGVPFLAQGKWEISAETGFSYTWGGAETKSEQFNFSASVPVPAEKEVTCTGILRKGIIDVPYKGTAILIYQDGTKIEAPESGVYRGVGAYDSQIEIGKAKPIPVSARRLTSMQRTVIDEKSGTVLEESIVVIE